MPMPWKRMRHSLRHPKRRKSDTLERTFVMVKPDGVQRCLAGQVIRRFELKGCKLSGMKLMTISQEMAAEHYGEHVGKPFYDKLISYITSGPVVAMVVEGKDAVSAVRTMVGKTNPLEAEPGTIRGDFGMETGIAVESSAAIHEFHWSSVSWLASVVITAGSCG